MKLFSLFFILLFTQPLRAESEAFVDLPVGCFAAHKYPCSLKATGSFLNFERDSQKFHLAQNSALIFFSESNIQLMQGKLWIRDSQALTLKVSPLLQMELTGEFFTEKMPDATMLVRN